LERLRYNNPGLVVDLGVGLWAWPMPIDWDNDGDLDLVVVSGGKPYGGTWFFENPGGSKMPVFKPARRLFDRPANSQLSPNGEVHTPGQSYPDFRNTGFEKPVLLPLKTEDFIQTKGRIRANQWKRIDFDGDGNLDLLVGIDDWTDYGWDDAYNSTGRWTNGPLRGWVFWARNTGSGYAKPEKILAGGKPVDGFGMPSPNLADFDGDGDLELICGEFLDGFTFYENTGSRTKPQYAAGRKLQHDSKPLTMDLEMITPVSVDWDADGDIDLIVGDEDGRVAFVENLGGARFLPPVYFKQEAEFVKFGALVTPFGFDWDGDGDEDIIAGNTAGYIGFIENLDGGDPPTWAAPRYLDAGGERIRIQAGPNGSIQGPAEAKWGYTTQTVADWDADGLPDIIANSIWGKVEWYRNVGTRTEPKLARAQPVSRSPTRTPAWTWWKPQAPAFVTQWRTTPFAIDWNKDGQMDLVMLDQEGHLAFFGRDRHDLLPGRRIFGLHLNEGWAGKSGRRKFTMVDWDHDGALDILINSTNVSFLKNVNGKYQDEGPVSTHDLSGHDTSPTTVDWDNNGVRDLLVGAEDGFLYHMKAP
jgi:hypothetical protein